MVLLLRVLSRLGSGDVPRLHWTVRGRYRAQTPEIHQRPFVAILRGDTMLNVSSDFLLVLATVFSSGWKIVTSFQIPGTNMNVAEFLFACMMVVFVIKVVPRILGFTSWWGSDRDSSD